VRELLRRARERGRPLISAHRGFSAAAPENTLAALRAALTAGADVAEIDVQLSRDGVLVLMHDRTLERTTDGAGPLRERSLAELKRLDAGSWFGPAHRGEPVPTLAEVLAWSGGQLGLLVELKSARPDHGPTVDRVIAEIERAGAAGWTAVAGFDHPQLREVHGRRPGWTIEMIYTARLADPVHAARACGATLVSLEPEHCVPEDVAELHGAGVAVLTTALGPAHVAELVTWDCDVVEADDVGFVISTLENSSR
jgi:glycerophosphoryl diester phosphodiesterase